MGLNTTRLCSVCIPCPLSPLLVLIEPTLIGRDRHFEPDQSVIHMPYVNECLAFATGKDKDGKPLLTIADLSRISSKRRAEAKAENPEFKLDKKHKTFGSSKYVSKDSVSLNLAYFVIPALLHYSPSSVVAWRTSRSFSGTSVFRTTGSPGSGSLMG